MDKEFAERKVNFGAFGFGLSALTEAERV